VTSKLLAKKIALSALEKKADDIVIMDLRKVTTMTDYFVVCSADSDTQVKAIADAVREGARLAGESIYKNEGYSDASWILLDYVDVVVHVFHKQTREFYNLEKLWGDAKFEHVSDEEPVKKPASRKKAAAADDDETPAVKKPAVKKEKKTAAEKKAKKTAAILKLKKTAAVTPKKKVAAKA
jgi:ribosome-associated protein